VAENMREPVLVDGRNLYDPRELAQLGFTYRGVGLPPVEAMAGTPRAAVAHIIGDK
jgi:UDPglucose 6-dehydrogenase